jgi:hypothetical protein
MHLAYIYDHRKVKNRFSRGFLSRRHSTPIQRRGSIVRLSERASDCVTYTCVTKAAISITTFARQRRPHTCIPKESVQPGVKPTRARTWAYIYDMYLRTQVRAIGKLCTNGAHAGASERASMSRTGYVD